MTVGETAAPADRPRLDLVLHEALARYQHPLGWAADRHLTPIRWQLANYLARQIEPRLDDLRPAPTRTALPSSTAPLAAGLPLVKGICPACGHPSLFLGSGGYVTCSAAECREPDAASTVLEQGVPSSAFEESREYKVVGGWGVDGARDAEHARRLVRQALAECPGCGAEASWRIVHTWEDDAQYLGPWQPLTDEEEPA
ncbi:hypothetical protein ACFVY4_27085 [Streptomyces sp. NPDC058299]|uniref:hypothetical protein n=1 Tax=Streptomyces sp. NPDC058299 TaxID=3346435 RepID=UPI0036E11699